MAVRGRPYTFCCHRALLTGVHPGNSLGAVRECVEAGVPRLEIDVRFLEDDSMVVSHDRVLSPLGEGAAPVRVPSNGSSLSSLEEVVAVMQDGQTLLQVDLKLMRPITPQRKDRLADALAPLGSRVLIGSQAHWNLRPIAQAGLPIAFDPTLQWHYYPGRTGKNLSPSRLGLHGLWDDSVIAHIPRIPAEEYVRSRVADLAGMVPGVVEWMVDIRTVLYLRSLGVRLGELLAERGIALAAWTLHDEGDQVTTSVIESLLEVGVSTIITDDPLRAAAYASRL
jgi:glycerophosphoryl diester phosphodiesterase